MYILSIKGDANQRNGRLKGKATTTASTSCLYITAQLQLLPRCVSACSPTNCCRPAREVILRSWQKCDAAEGACLPGCKRRPHSTSLLRGYAIRASAGLPVIDAQKGTRVPLNTSGLQPCRVLSGSHYKLQHRSMHECYFSAVGGLVPIIGPLCIRASITR